MPRKKVAPPRRSSKSDTYGGEKPTQTQIAERVSTVRDMLLRGDAKWEIKETCHREWGVSWRTVENYLARAREQINAETGLDDPEEKALLQNTCTHSLRNDLSSSDFRQRHSAIRQLCKIHGLEAPLKVAPTNTAGEDLEIALSTAPTAVLEFIERVRAQADETTDE